MLHGIHITKTNRQEENMKQKKTFILFLFRVYFAAILRFSGFYPDLTMQSKMPPNSVFMAKMASKNSGGGVPSVFNSHCIDDDNNSFELDM